MLQYILFSQYKIIFIKQKKYKNLNQQKNFLKFFKKNIYI